MPKLIPGYYNLHLKPNSLWFHSWFTYDKPTQYIKKQNITLLTKVHLVKAVVFPVVVCGCESWIIKKAKR